jgi:CheY-like chemotaxis protein
MIQRNTTIPTRKTETFSTAADNQTAVEVHVLQGERPMANQNRTLGKFHLAGIPPAPRGVPQIEVTFDIDANGILNASAKDLATGKDQKITITSSSGLNKQEVERMAKEAKAHAAEDKEKREEIEAKNQLDAMVYSIEKMLRERGDRISGSERGEVENAIADAKKALDSNDKRSMDQARERLTQASHKLAEQMYADDHPVVREGLAALINRRPDMRVAAEATNGREAVEQFFAQRPDVALLDLRMPVMNGVEALIVIRGKIPAARLAIVSTFQNEQERSTGPCRPEHKVMCSRTHPQRIWFSASARLAMAESGSHLSSRPSWRNA